MDSSQEKRTAASSAAVNERRRQAFLRRAGGALRRQHAQSRRGRDRQRPGHPRHRLRRHRRHRLQVGRPDLDRRVPRSRRQGRGQHRRHGRGPARADRGPGRPHPAVEAEGRADADLEHGGGGLPRRQGDHRPRGRAHQGRPHRRRRAARVPAGLAGRHQAGQEPRELPRRGPRVQGHQPRPPPQQHRALAQGRAREGVREEEGRDPQEAQGRRGDEGHGQEHHRLRRVHRPRRHRRPAPHHRHLLGPRQPPLRALLGGRRGRGGGPQVRPRHRARLARLQAAPGGSLDAGRQEVPARRARPRQGGLDRRLRRVRRARGGGRGPDPRQRDVVDQEGGQSLQGPRGRPGGRGDRLRARHGQPAHLAVAAADRDEPVGGPAEHAIRSAR